MDALNTAQAAQFLGVSARTMQRMVHDGEIPSVTVRGRRTFSLIGLERWKRQRETESLARKRKVRASVISMVMA